MIKIKEAIIVEGKYDKIKLSSIIDAVIIQTDGYRIFKDPEKLSLIRYYAKKTGIIILTDSDSAGFKIRGFLKGAVKGNIKNVYIPDIFGKEKRKEKPSAEGKLGVEGIPVDIILDAFKKSGISTENTDVKKQSITNFTFFELGLSGKPNSKILRQKLQKYLGLPELMSSSSLMEVLNTMYDESELKEVVKKLEVM